VQYGIIGFVTSPERLLADIAALQTALTAERAARQQAEARASGAEAMVACLKLLIAKMKRERFGQSADRGRKLLDQLKLQLEELEASATEDAVAAGSAEPDASSVRSLAGKRPVRAPLPAHLLRERVIVPAPPSCPCCGGKLAKLGEDVTETLEVVPRQWKVTQTVREKFSCRSCEKITQPPAPFHVIPRARAGASLLAMILYANFGEHQPLNRQSESYAREDIELDVSTLADWVGACSASLAPLLELIRHHVLAGERVHGDDTPVPVLATQKTVIGRVWAYVRDDRSSRAGTRPQRCSSIRATARRAPEPASRRLCRDPPGRCLCRLWRSLRRQAQTRPNHPGCLLEPQPSQILRARRSRQIATGRRSGAPHRRDLRD
jgi:transposase